MNRLWFLTAICAAFFSFNSYGQAFRFQGTVRDSASRKTIENMIQLG